jgi:hypothetical protein
MVFISRLLTIIDDIGHCKGESKSSAFKNRAQLTHRAIFIMRMRRGWRVSNRVLTTNSAERSKSTGTTHRCRRIEFLGASYTNGRSSPNNCKFRPSKSIVSKALILARDVFLGAHRSPGDWNPGWTETSGWVLQDFANDTRSKTKEIDTQGQLVFGRHSRFELLNFNISRLDEFDDRAWNQNVVNPVGGDSYSQEKPSSRPSVRIGSTFDVGRSAF